MVGGYQHSYWTFSLLQEVLLEVSTMPNTMLIVETLLSGHLLSVFMAQLSYAWPHTIPCSESFRHDIRCPKSKYFQHWSSFPRGPQVPNQSRTVAKHQFNILCFQCHLGRFCFYGTGNDRFQGGKSQLHPPAFPSFRSDPSHPRADLTGNVTMKNLKGKKEKKKHSFATQMED